MNEPGILSDEHVPGSCIAALRSIGYEVRRAKDEFSEGTDDATLLEYAEEAEIVVLTCDKRFTIVDGEHVDTHAGVIYADQGHLHGRPEDAAATIDRIVQTIPFDDLHGEEWYLTDWS